MVLEVHSEGRTLYVESPGRRTCVRRHIPKHHKRFKAELAYFRARLAEWLDGQEVETIYFSIPPAPTYWHRAMLSAIIEAAYPPTGLPLLYTILNGEEDVTDDCGD